jgi:cytochrome P450
MKYNPDRFNPSHKFYKRPNGEKRHSFDYMPFFVGMRACAGKSFSYLLGCTLLALLVKDFKFLPQNKEDLIERPIYKNEYKFPEIRLKKRNS